MLSWMEHHMLPCAYKAMFGIDCPICGFQRSLIQLMKGNFTGSLSIYPPLIPFLILIVLGIGKIGSGELIKTKFLKSYALVVLIIVLINYIIKLFT